MSIAVAPYVPPANQSVPGAERARESSAVKPGPVLCLVLVLSAAYAFWHLRRGLIPHDDGAIAQAAERVMRGELPHRDFDDIYTGGLALLDAAGFRLLGASFWSMRLVLFGAFVAWVPAVFYAASRFVRPVAAGAVTLLAVVWSVPNYPAPMPSWYNLFLATAGVAALLRHLEEPRTRWLVLAGIAGGLSVLVKVVGLYYVAGVLLYLVSRAHAQSRARAGAEPSASPAYATMVSAALLLFVLALFSLVKRGLGAAELVHFVAPGALAAVLLAHEEWTVPAGPARARIASLVRVLTPFVVGVAVPVALFLVPYVRSGAVGALFTGVFILPGKRFAAASVAMLSLRTMLFVLPVLAAVLAERRWPERMRAWGWMVLAVLLVALLVASGSVAPLYREALFPVRNMVPVLSLAGLLLVSRLPRDGEDAPRRARLLLLTCVTALCSLVQFPFAIPVYFCYVAPLAVLLALALFAAMRPMPVMVPGALLAFYLAFAVMRVNNTAIFTMGFSFRPHYPTHPMDLPRAQLNTATVQAWEYGEIVRLLREHARGEYTWAAPDSPEVYFLSGLRNPTRNLFDFLGAPEGEDARTLAMLEARGITAIVLNKEPEFSHGITQALFEQLARRYPESADVASFQVRWRR